MSKNPEKNWFGEEEVTPEQKTAKVRGVFDSVAPKYDIMNDVMSGGLHRIWKDRLIQMISPVHGQNYLDVAGGTGDIAFRIARHLDRIEKRIKRRAERKAEAANTLNENQPNIPSTQITLCDLDEDMLRVGRDRALDKGFVGTFDWVTGNAEHLPIPDNCVDIYTISFGLRNVTHIDTALKEVVRVLKPGGRFYCLEFSQVNDPILQRLYDTYSYNFIPKFGNLIANDADSYQYLVESIRKFPKKSNLAQRMSDVGLDDITFTDMTFGVVCIHSGQKPL